MKPSWAITRDVLGEEPNVVHPETPELVSDFPHRFRLYDDDDELYYEGRSRTNNDNAAFRPLDWAMNNAGCTRIDYLQPWGKWETL